MPTLSLAPLLWACALPLAAAQDDGRAVAERVDAYLQRCAAFGWSGVVLVARGEEVLFQHGYGFADREGGRANAPDTLFEIASTTKPFTACAVLALVEDGQLALDDSIAEHLPGVPEERANITVEHLLAHTSGMPRRAAGGGGDDLEAAVRGYFGTPAVRAPGAGYEYWNGGYALLAGIVERVSGAAYTDYCRERLFARAGLEHTGFTGDADLPLELQALGYDGDAPVRRAAEHAYGSYGWQYRGMGGIVTSAPDLLKFVRALEAGRVLELATVARMERPRTEHYGLGWGLAETKRGTRRVGHGGDVRGFHTQLQRFPDEDVVVIVLSNVDGVPLYKVAWNVEALVFDAEPPYPQPPQARALPERELAALLGVYVAEDGERLVVERSGGGVAVGAEGLRACAALDGAAVEPALLAHVATARGLLDAVREGAPQRVLDVLAEHVPKSWPATLVERIWPRHLETWGALEGVRELGARVGPRGGVEVLFALEHARGSARLKVVLYADRLSIFDLKGPRLLVRRSFARGADGLFHGFSWEGAGGAATLAFLTGEGAARRLEVRTPAGAVHSFERQP